MGAEVYVASMKSIDNKLNIVIPDRPEDSIDLSSRQEISNSQCQNSITKTRRGPKQLHRPHTSTSPRRFYHKFSFQHQNSGNKSYGRQRNQRPSTSIGNRVSTARENNCSH